MNASLEHRRPQHWQDFETLCKKLFQKMWDCPDLKQHGRSGQMQQGVDIFGKPSYDKKKIYGIQCKGKSSYTHSQLTHAEIDREIALAKTFKPGLAKFYFATTSLRDVHIQEYIRLKDQELTNQGLFEVDVYFWEDLAEKIDEYQEVYDWYVKSQRYVNGHAVKVTWDNGAPDLEIRPKFYRRIPRYFPATPSIKQMMKLTEASQQFYHNNGTFIHQSYCPIKFKIENTGTSSIDNFKLRFQFNDPIPQIRDSNIERRGPMIILARDRALSNIIYDPVTGSGDIVASDYKIVGDDIFTSHIIYIKPECKDYTIEVEWKLISSNFKTNGTLTIKVAPELKDSIVDRFLDGDRFEPYRGEPFIEDIVEKEDHQ